MAKRGKKRPKTELVFDKDDRREFLTGFQKRKAERKVRAKEILKERIRSEKILQKQKRKERLNENKSYIPEVEDLLEPTLTYELPQQVVSITAFDANDISGQLGLTLGHNQKISKDLDNNYDSH